MRRKIFLLFFAALALGFALLPSRAQSPAPIIIQAATPAPVRSAVAQASAQPDSKTLVQLLHEMQTTNADTIKKQQATLETLDALQKAAEEIKIFAKRG